MSEQNRFRIFATCDIGPDALNILRQRGYEVEVYPHPEPPPKAVIFEKLRDGIDGLITTLRDPIDEEVFKAGAGRLKVELRLPSVSTISTMLPPTATASRSPTRRTC
jgi:phosphoglycerate dehydrogenase-like enzyme